MKQGTLTSYIIGFLTSIALTLAAFFLVLRPGFFHLTSGMVLVAILGLAVVQLIVQMLFFLHLGSGPESRARLAVFFSTLALVLIIVIGSLWIMEHLNYNMTPDQINQYIQNQQGF